MAGAVKSAWRTGFGPGFGGAAVPGFQLGSRSPLAAASQDTTFIAEPIGWPRPGPAPGALPSGRPTPGCRERALEPEGAVNRLPGPWGHREAGSSESQNHFLFKPIPPQRRDSAILQKEDETAIWN